MEDTLGTIGLSTRVKARAFLWSDATCLSALFLILGVLAAFSFPTAIHFEEGRDANAYLMALEGKLPFRDFDWLYGPLSFFVYPTLFSLFGDSIVVLRFAYVGLTFTVAGLSYAISRQFLSPVLSVAGGLLGACFLQIPYYTYNHILFVILALSAVLVVMRDTSTASPLRLVGAGALTGLAVLVKPITLGVGLTGAISVFLLGRRRFGRWVAFAVGTAISLLSYTAYFLSQTLWLGREIRFAPFFAKDSITQIEQKARLDFGFLAQTLWDRMLDVILFPRLGLGISKAVVGQYNSFVLLLLPAIPLLYFVARRYWARRFKDLAPLDLMAIVGLFVSLETIPIAHGMNRAFSAQVPLLLACILVSRLLWRENSKLAQAVFVVMILYLVAIPLLYYPLGKAKRYPAALSLPRLQGLKVTSGEQLFYHGLYQSLWEGANNRGLIAVVGYHPNIAYFTGTKNVFEDNEYVYLKMDFLRRARSEQNRPQVDSAIQGFEQALISTITESMPDMVVTFDGDQRYQDDLKYLDRLNAYVTTHYEPKQTFESADVYGIGQDSVRVTVHARRP